MTSVRFPIALGVVSIILAGCSADPATTVGSSSTVVALVTASTRPVTESTGPSAPTDTSSAEPATGAVDTSQPSSKAVGRCTQVKGPQKITLWHLFAGDQANLTFQSLVDEFNASHPGISLEATKINGFEELRRKLQDLSPDQWPDIVVTAPAALKSMADNGLTIPPTECADASAGRELLPVVRAAYSLNGELQAEPFGVSTPVLMFDASEVRRAGLDPAHPPTTLQELAAASKRVVDSGVSPHGLVVSDVVGEFLIYQGAAQRGDLVAEPDNGRSTGPVSVDLATPDNVAAMTWLSDVVENNGGVWVGSSAGSDDLVKVIDPTDGGVFALHTSASIGDVITAIDAGSLPGVELGVGPMPGPAAGGTVGGNAMFLIDHGSPSRAAAGWRAIDWLTTPAQMARFDAATGYIPPSTAVASTPLLVAAYAKHPQLRVGYDQLAASGGNSVAAGPAFGPGPEVDAVLGDMTTKIVYNKLDPRDALTQSSMAINDSIRTYAAVTGKG